MTYKGIEIGEKPTLGMVIEFLNKNKNFVVNASELFYKYEDRNWLTKKGKPIKTLESIIVAENGVQVLKRRKDIRKNKEKLLSCTEEELQNYVEAWNGMISGKLDTSCFSNDMFERFVEGFEKESKELLAVSDKKPRFFMKYKGKTINKPTLEMIKDYLKQRGLNKIDAVKIFKECEKQGWLTQKGERIVSLETYLSWKTEIREAIIKARNEEIRKQQRDKEKTRKEIWEKYSTKEPKKEETKSYSELLKDPRWQKKRLEIMERDNWSCLKCGCGLNDGTPLNVHHKYYRKGRAPWEYDDSCYVTLCEKCHAKQHAK